MLQHSSLDGVFRALADSTRRALVERLSAGPASVSELATPFSVSLTAIGQHLHVLETSGLVRTRKVGRVRTVELVPDRFAAAERWFASHRGRWERRLDQLGALLEEEDEGADEEIATRKRRRKKR
jgi:DNA-binding transcriptional ArsR family regulator